MNTTPGPWRTQLFSSFATQVRGRNNRAVAETWVQNTTPKTAEGNLRQARENEANARLIAAAPELLDALRNLEQTAGIAAERDDPQRVAARAAIAKAMGESE